MTSRQHPAAFKRDYVAGALMVVLGIGAIAEGRRYPMGTLRLMGPGFFPVALGVILALTGLAIGVGARFAAAADERPASHPPEWRGWLLICAAMIAFVVLGRYGGLVPATLAIVLISALADRRNSIRSAVVLALAILVVSFIVFWWALQVRLPLFGWG
jgi:hypothetical protein